MMNDKEILAIADKFYEADFKKGTAMTTRLLAFARAIEKAAREDERELAAKVCEFAVCDSYELGTDERRAWNESSVTCAAAIRARKGGE